MAKTVKIINVISGVNENETIDRIDEAMQRFTIDSLKVWLRNTTDGVPVWSGASKASFLKLAARARLSLPISPVAPTPPGDRTSLGRSTSVGRVFMNKGKEYGWEWTSNLDYIHIVERNYNFVSRGLTAIQGRQPTLPPPELKYKNA